MWCRISREVWNLRIGRWLPRLVWLGDEIDVRITFVEDPLRQSDPLRGLFSGGVFEIEQQLKGMGITFDTGMGCGGRDWEWDYALSGPIRVKFKGRAQEPGKRRSRPKPALVVSHG
jgi:hypothetical protein